MLTRQGALSTMIEFLTWWPLPSMLAASILHKNYWNQFGFWGHQVQTAAKSFISYAGSHLGCRAHQVQSSIAWLNASELGSIFYQSHYCATIICKITTFSIHLVRCINWLTWTCIELEAGYRKLSKSALTYYAWWLTIDLENINIA